MEQDDLINSIENPSVETIKSQETNAPVTNQAPIQREVNPLPQDLNVPKKETDIFKIINLVSYVTLGLALLFLLILYIIGFLK